MEYNGSAMHRTISSISAPELPWSNTPEPWATQDEATQGTHEYMGKMTSNPRTFAPTKMAYFQNFANVPGTEATSAQESNMIRDAHFLASIHTRPL